MKYSESILQEHCVTWFRFQYPHFKKLLFAVPNGGHRNAITASILKREGVVAGVSDLILFVPNSAYHALCIEMKTKSGHQSELQKEWQNLVESQGYKYVVCHSFQEFENEIKNYLI